MTRHAPYIVRRGFGLTFRIAVPPDLRPAIGAREITKALPALSRRHAVATALSLAAQAKHLFNELRSTMTKQTRNNRFDYTMDFELDELGLVKGVKVIAEPHETEAATAALDAVLESNAKRRQLSPMPPTAFGTTLPVTTARIEHSPVSASVPTLGKVVEKFLLGYEKKNKPAMLRKHNPVLKMFREIVGDITVDKIKQANVNEFFELVNALPPKWKKECERRKVGIRELASFDHEETIGPKTFDSYVDCIRSFLRTAKRDWQDQGFPLGLTTDGIEYTGDREEGESKQRPLTQQELKRLFEGAEIKAFASQRESAHMYWLPHIGLFTGARVNEICQLNPQCDILQDGESGIWYFWITKRTEADPRIRKFVKPGSERKVPLHAKLIELGLLNYVQAVKEAGAKLLFPLWNPFNNRASGEAEKWFRQFLRDTGLRDETPFSCLQGMHAFRHTLLTYGAMQKPRLVLFGITGHAQGDVPIPADGAGRDYLTVSMLDSLADKSKLLNELDYGLNFSKPR